MSTFKEARTKEFRKYALKYNNTEECEGGRPNICPKREALLVTT